MTTPRLLLAALATFALATSACGEREPKKDVGDTVGLGPIDGDTSLAGIDTTGLADAADVAMAEEPGSVTSVLGETPGTASAPRPIDTIPATEPVSAPATVPAPAPAAPAPSTPAAPAPATATRRTPAPASTPAREPARAPATASTPARTTAPAPSATASRTAPAPGTVSRPRARTGPRAPASACASPAREDQRRCLMGYLAVSDVDLNRTYQQLIAELKRQADTPAGAREPDQVQRLREAQRAWLVYRDRECRSRNRGREGPLWAPVRAYCLSEFTDAREAELQAALRRVRRGQPLP